MQWARASRTTRLAVLVAVCLSGAALAATVAGAQLARPAATGVNVRILGQFLMTGRVTAAVGIPGERTGERLVRRWRVTPQRCAESDCQRVTVVRNRGGGLQTKLTLRRVGFGAYRGTGQFWAPLGCLGRTYAHGSLVPYTLTLTVSHWVQRGAIRYATQVVGSYSDAQRSDNTPCPLGIVHDGAQYSGRLKSALPSPPAPPTPTTTTAPTTTPTVPTPTAPTPTPTPATTATTTPAG